MEVLATSMKPQTMVLYISSCPGFVVASNATTLRQAILSSIAIYMLGTFAQLLFNPKVVLFKLSVITSQRIVSR